MPSSLSPSAPKSIAPSSASRNIHSPACYSQLVNVLCSAPMAQEERYHSMQLHREDSEEQQQQGAKGRDSGREGGKELGEELGLCRGQQEQQSN